ncbi:glutathione S-transferase T3-like [Lactuca sativa]|uniref:glutathione S-transferase T3-like n=1 Tax=Lactuca sativa TaxID=4236 RepID=UPI0022AE8CDD|nr:glutathione S-transferase T3-like [Lactuca sativa]
MLLAKAWLQISEDSITGSQQRDKEFWRRITAYYEKSNTSNVARTQANLKTHWHYMNPFAVAFNQMYIVLKSQHLSGWSEDDLKRATFEHYHARNGADFRHEHIWNIVKNEQKWKGSSTAYGASMSSSNTESFINLDNDEVTTRPIGRNAAKKAAKGKATNSTSSSGNRLDEILKKHIEENKKTFERYQNSLDMKNALKERKMKIKEEKVKNDEISIIFIFMDPSTMSEDGREIWINRCDQIKIKYNMK